MESSSTFSSSISEFFGGLLGDEENYQQILNRLMQLHQPQGPPPASKEEIDSLPTLKIDKNTQEKKSHLHNMF